MQKILFSSPNSGTTGSRGTASSLSFHLTICWAKENDFLVLFALFALLSIRPVEFFCVAAGNSCKSPGYTWGIKYSVMLHLSRPTDSPLLLRRGSVVATSRPVEFILRLMVTCFHWEDEERGKEWKEARDTQVALFLTQFVVVDAIGIYWIQWMQVRITLTGWWPVF